MPDTKQNEARPANRPVVAAVDFSADSEAAALWAADYAARCEAPLLLVHVVHDPAEDPGHYREGDEEWSEPMASVAERRMDQFMDALRAGHPDNMVLQTASPMIVSGLPAGRIVEIAMRENARLITVGTSGRSGLEHVLLGSVAEEVMQQSPVPVTVVKAEGSAP